MGSQRVRHNLASEQHTHTHTHTHTHMQCNITSHKEQILPLAATCMELEGTMLGEISQAEKDKYHMISLICGI